MFQTRKSNKVLALFVLAFLCLNVGGAFCLTACTQLFASEASADSDAHLSEHCKQAKKAAEERERDLTKVEPVATSCCMMPVAMFAAPVEKRSDPYAHQFAAVVSLSVEHQFAAPRLYSGGTPASPVYRPPPLNRQHDRIFHSVFRI